MSYLNQLHPQTLPTNPANNVSPDPNPRAVVDPPRVVEEANDAWGSDSDNIAPFPRAASGNNTPSLNMSEDSSVSQLRVDKSQRPRGRFQSEAEGTIRRRKRPNYDELVNLGAPSGNTSDLMTPRDSSEGNALRKPLIIKEEGKARLIL